MTLPYSVEPLALGLAFGATVRGLKQEHLASDAVLKGLTDLWTDKGVISQTTDFCRLRGCIYAPLERRAQGVQQ